MAVPLAAIMLVAMMEFTTSILTRRPRRSKKPVDKAELERRLLEMSIESSPVRITPAAGGGLEIRDYELADEWREQFKRVAFSVVYRARIGLDERRHELRWYESVRSRSLFLGFDGWIPRLQGGYSYHGGLVNMVGKTRAYAFGPGLLPRVTETLEFDIDTVQLKREISDVVTQAGWGFKPVTLPFLASGRWIALNRWIIPPPIARLPGRLFWGILYPASYAVLIGYLMGLAWLDDPASWNRHNLLIVLLVSAGWWGVWGFLAWALCGFPGVRRRKRRSRSRRAR